MEVSYKDLVAAYGIVNGVLRRFTLDVVGGIKNVDENKEYEPTWAYLAFIEKNRWYRLPSLVTGPVTPATVVDRVLVELNQRKIFKFEGVCFRYLRDRLTLLLGGMQTDHPGYQRLLDARDVVDAELATMDADLSRCRNLTVEQFRERFLLHVAICECLMIQALQKEE